MLREKSSRTSCPIKHDKGAIIGVFLETAGRDKLSKKRMKYLFVLSTKPIWVAPRIHSTCVVGWSFSHRLNHMGVDERSDERI